ncbi:MAG: VanZ family protein [Firmicutes bacterium]|nr:VanZ family protein [Bacillota bacterium]
MSLIIIFALYIIGVYHFTGSGTLYNSMMYGFNANRFMVNLIPFSREIDTLGYMLNVLLFVPLGFLVPVLWEKGRSFLYTFRVGIALSLLIEASQLINNRSFDVDDLILNTVGGIIGFLVFMIVNKCTKSKIEMKNVPVSFLVICVLIPFAARFFLYNEMGFANIIYGF